MPVLPYKGQRTKEGFAAFAARMTGPAVHQLASQNAHDAFGKNESVWFLYGKGADTNEQLEAHFLKTAKHFQDSLLFGETHAKDVLAGYK